MKTINFEKKILLGQVDGENIYLSAPSWDCGWYWGFGYLGNKNCHYHVDGLKEVSTYNHEKKVFEYEFVNLHDGFIRHFGKSFIVRPSQIWEFAELFETFYSLKDTCEVLGRGGSHLTTNPCADIIKNLDEVKRINEIVLPSIFEAIYKILEANANNKKMFSELVKINNEGDTMEVVKFMFANSITCDDLEAIDGISKNDYSVIHDIYYKVVHGKVTL